MTDGSGGSLAPALVRLAAEAAALLPADPRDAGNAAPAHGPENANPDGLPAAIRVLAGRLAARLAEDDPPADRDALVELLARVDALDGRVHAAARDVAARRRDAFERGLRELRACTSVAELLERLAPIMLGACDCERVAVGIVDDGAWTSLREADRRAGDGGAASYVPPTPLADLPVERAAFTSGRPAVVEAVGPVDGRPARPACVIAPTFVGGRARGLFRAEFRGPAPRAEDVASVERMGRALGHAFEMLEMHERLLSVDRTVARLRETVGARAPEDVDGATGATFSGGVSVAGRVARPDGRGVRPQADLTPRQRQTLELMLLGLSNAQIAERLVVGVPTVKSHVSAILRAVGAVNRAEAIGRYLEREDT